MTVVAFRTLTGLLVPAITAVQMREVDRVAVEEVGPNMYQMMENAGRNLASLCVELLGDRWASAPVVVLAGTGGNGGGGRLANVRDLGTLEAELVVDAVLGYSIDGAPHGVAAGLIRWIASCTGPVISLDVPSGMDSTTGTASGDFVRATTTMTLAVPKTGLDTDAVGALWLADIGIPREVYRRVGVHLPDRLFTPGYRVRLVAAEPT